MTEPAGRTAPTDAGADPAMGARALRAGLRLGGVTLARHQLGTLLALGCDRVICVAHALDPEMLALQQVTEHAGARFHLVSGPRGLLGLVTATDEIIGLADGLSAAPDTVRELIEAGPVVLVQPIEHGLEAGFERLDINHAAAGAWRVPGRLVERLVELPPDCDAFSALQRIALQAGVPQRMLPAPALSHWALLRGEAEAVARERDWIRFHATVPGGNNPSLALAQLLVRQFGAALLHAGSGSTMVAAAALAMLLLALVAGWFGWLGVSFALAALAWPTFLAAALLGRIMRATLRLPSPRLARAVIYGVLIDALLVLLMSWSMRSSMGLAGEYPVFAPVMLVGLCRLVASHERASWAAWLQDRGLLAVILLGGWMFGAGAVIAQVLALLVLGAGLFAPARQRTTANVDLTPPV